MSVVKVELNQKIILKHLMTLFLHDLSEFNEEQEFNQESGLFEFDAFEWFFEKEGLFPFFIKHEDDIIGFILLQSSPYTNPERYDYLINSFFILKKYRRKGLGKQAVQDLFQQCPGRYAIGQLSNNIPAIQFWRKIYEYMNVEFQEKEEMDEGLKIRYQYLEI
ncbi:hypothetical protein AZ66_19890 [Paenibacillus sp. E194]|uniref:GNAT family N-acetyltransferase n=1 Tax=Paenibacillus sp. E194 TaxID=1458845 RepID=UPI0005C9F69D|nr:GNAT family N-acetyltransferase [Paenibacillus sp. E194]KJB86260.1 hypothetical protein AZ66_19890 [Paenibacillus sp. E194]